jgi:hypothetical protein
MSITEVKKRQKLRKTMLITYYTPLSRNSGMLEIKRSQLAQNEWFQWKERHKLPKNIKFEKYRWDTY